jgi:hypothetical protein
LSLKASVDGSGASTLATAEYAPFRTLRVSFGGKMSLSYVALTSAAVRGEPS